MGFFVFRLKAALFGNRSTWILASQFWTLLPRTMWKQPTESKCRLTQFLLYRTIFVYSAASVLFVSFANGDNFPLWKVTFAALLKEHFDLYNSYNLMFMDRIGGMLSTTANWFFFNLFFSVNKGTKSMFTVNTLYVECLVGKYAVTQTFQTSWNAFRFKDIPHVMLK